MKVLICSSTGKVVSLVKQIASSGEGEIWQTDTDGFLAKVYHSPTVERIAKLEVMVSHPPTDPNSHLNHISFAWPQSLLRSPNQQIWGFLMPTIQGGRELLNIYSPQLRKKLGLEVDWRFLHVAALNIASIIRAIHTNNYVLGDIKPQNILINNRALPSVIDTDSFQVRHPQNGKVYRCLVGSEGFTPPELLGKDLALTEQTEIHDRFRLAVVIYLLLFGDQPFKGKWAGKGDAPDPSRLVELGFWPYAANSLIQPGPLTIPLNIVHPEVKQCFLRCFNDGHITPHLRPTAEEWYKALKLATSELTICGKVQSHYYSRTYGKCYWCDRKKQLGIDIFSRVMEFKQPPPITASPKVTYSPRPANTIINFLFPSKQPKPKQPLSLLTLGRILGVLMSLPCIAFGIMFLFTGIWYNLAIGIGFIFLGSACLWCLNVIWQ